MSRSAGWCDVADVRQLRMNHKPPDMCAAMFIGGIVSVGLIQMKPPYINGGRYAAENLTGVLKGQKGKPAHRFRCVMLSGNLPKPLTGMEIAPPYSAAIRRCQGRGRMWQ